LSPYLNCAPILSRSEEINASLDSLYIHETKSPPKATTNTLISILPLPRKPIVDNSIKRVFNPDDQMLGEYNTHASDVYFKGISTLLPPKQSAPENNSGESNIRDQYVTFHITRYKILFQIQTRYQDLAFKLDYSHFQRVLIKYYSIPESPDWFLKTIEQIISHPLQTPLGVSLKFDLSIEAATHNMNILCSYTNSVHLYINANKHSFMGYGSEFRPIHIIERLLMHHRSWPSFLNQLQQGSKWPLTKKYDRVG
jgi:hypothetical protein